MTELDARLGALLDQRKAKQRFRTLKQYDVDPTSTSGLVDFSSNDYLSLTSSSALRSSYLSRLAATRDIFGSTGSRLLSGCTTAHSLLENRLSTFFNSPSALLFNSGWDANVSFFSTVPQPSDWVIYDELVHASVHSGLRASRVPTNHRIPFEHNSPQALHQVLDKITKQQASVSNSSSSTSQPTIFLALESLYSMDGDMSPLPELLDVFQRHVPRNQQCVVIDEAHSTGVYGKQGRGVVHALGEEGGWGNSHRSKGRVDVRLMTFGKAVGCSGAVLLCSPTVRSFLINFARPLIFSTALPHSTLIALECVWDVLQSEEGDRRRENLSSNIVYFHSVLDPLLIRTSPSILQLPPSPDRPFASSSSPHLSPNPPAPIIGLLTPTPHALSTYLLEKGFIVRPVVPPTVPPGSERVRICLRAGMEKDVIDRLVGALAEWVDEQQSQSSTKALRAKL